MTARERVLGTINAENVDRVPIFDLIQNIDLVEHITGEKVTLENGLELLLKTISRCLDATRCIAPPNPENTWTDDAGFVYKTEWWTTWVVERPHKTTEELLEFIRRDIERINCSAPDSLWAFTGEINFGVEKDPNQHFRYLQERLGNVVLFPTESPVGLDTAFYRGGLELFCYAYADAPDLVSQWLEALTQHEVQRVHRCADAELAPVTLVYADLADKHGPMFSPTFLRAEFFPRLKRLVEAWHSHGVKVIYHSDGDYRMVLDDFRDAGVDGINPVEPLEGADHLKESREGWPDLTLMGGMDCSNLLCFGSIDEVRDAVRHALDVTMPGKRYILGSSAELHPACRCENIMAMWETTLEYGRY